jgi:adenosylcobinamide-GDP ribazoletransferase
MFFTRIPVPSFKDYNEDDLNKCTRYFPLVGIFVGGISFLVFYLSSLLFPTSISVVFSLLAGVLVTGAFHEDGFADCFDGFGGGWSKSKILDIMKDSRLGTYGTVALIFLFLLKFYALSAIVERFQDNWFSIFVIFITYHSLGRLAGISVSFLLPYSREDATSKSKPLAKSFSWKEVLGSALFGLLPFVFLLADISIYFLTAIPVLMILVLYSKYYFNKWIDGFTGDCLGCVEQFAEVFILLSFIAGCKFL